MIKTALSLCLIAALAECQPEREFEVASVKATALLPGQPLSPGQLGIFTTPTSVDLKNVTLRTIIGRAFQFPNVQVVGPEFLGTTFTIMAKLPAGASQSEIPAMLQDLLRKRFGMESHEEERRVRGAELSIRNPEALHKQLLTGNIPRMPPRDMEQPAGVIIPLSSLNEPLSDLLKVPVLKVPGLASTASGAEDKYFFWLDTADGASSITRSLKEYGITLSFGRVNVPFVVVDRINKIPTEN